MNKTIKIDLTYEELNTLYSSYLKQNVKSETPISKLESKLSKGLDKFEGV